MKDRKTCIVGVVGGSASGKGTVVQRLLDHYGDRAAVLRMDDYYRPIGEIPRDGDGEPNFDVPAALALDRLAENLDQLRSGVDLNIDSYTFNQPGVLPEPLHIPARPLRYLHFALHLQRNFDTQIGSSFPQKLQSKHLYNLNYSMDFEFCFHHPLPQHAYYYCDETQHYKFRHPQSN